MFSRPIFALYGKVKINLILLSACAYIIVRLQNTGIYRIYNPKALSCGAQAKHATKGLKVIKSIDPFVLKSNLFRL